MKIIEHAQLIEIKDVDLILKKAKEEFRAEKRNEDYLYAYLTGVLHSAYKDLCRSIIIYHNSQIKEKHEESINS